MIESEILYRSQNGGEPEILVLSTTFKNKLVYTSVVTRQTASASANSPDTADTTRRAVQYFGSCIKGNSYREVAINSMVAVPISILSALQKAEQEQAILFFASSEEIKEAAFLSLNAQTWDRP